MAIPKLLDLLDISGCIVTIDAMGCQTDIAQKIVDAGGDYVLALKKNQAHLYEDVQFLFEDIERNADTDSYRDCDIDTTQTVEKDHGRIETRRAMTLSGISYAVCCAGLL